jgi:hypothetical protein
MAASISRDQLGFAIDDSSVIVVDALPVAVRSSVHDALLGRDEGLRTQRCQTSDCALTTPAWESAIRSTRGVLD